MKEHVNAARLLHTVRILQILVCPYHPPSQGSAVKISHDCRVLNAVGATWAPVTWWLMSPSGFTFNLQNQSTVSWVNSNLNPASTTCICIISPHYYWLFPWFKTLNTAVHSGISLRHGGRSIIAQFPYFPKPLIWNLCEVPSPFSFPQGDSEPGKYYQTLIPKDPLYYNSF